MSTFKVGSPCKYCQTVITVDMVYGATIICRGCGISESASDQPQKLVSGAMYVVILVAILAVCSYIFRDVILMRVAPNKVFSRMTEAQLHGEIRVCENIKSLSCEVLVYKRLHELQPTKTEYSARYAFLLTETHDFNTAEPIYLAIINHGYATHDLYGNYARNCLGQHKTDDAIRWYKKALQIAPSLLDITQELANTYVAAGQKLSALSLLETYTRHYPSRGETLTPQIETLRAESKAAAFQK